MLCHPGSMSCALPNQLDLRVVIFRRRDNVVRIRVRRPRRNVLVASDGGSGGVLHDDAGGAVVGVENAWQPLGDQVGASHAELTPRKGRHYRNRAEENKNISTKQKLIMGSLKTGQLDAWYVSLGRERAKEGDREEHTKAC